MKVLLDFNHFGGKHCQTAALKNVLKYHDLDISEEMLLGLGGGIGFIYWYMKQMPAPLVGTRYGGKDESFLTNTCQRIGGKARLFQSGSPLKGYQKLVETLQSGEPGYVFVDMVYLPYMALPDEAHFGGHTIVVYGIDEEEKTVYIADRGQKSVAATIDDLKNARNSKFPPFPPENKILEIEYPEKIHNLEEGIKEAIKECCTTMVNPPISNIGVAGIKKWASLVTRWPEQFKGLNLYGCLLNTFIYIEIGGTGGSAFRPMYAQFLREAETFLKNPGLSDVGALLVDSGKIWSEIGKAVLPDSWPALKRTRELAVEKNRVFEKQKPGTLQKMLEINREMDTLREEAVSELEERNVQPLLCDVRGKILECYEVEKEAFETLHKISETMSSYA